MISRSTSSGALLGGVLRIVHLSTALLLILSSAAFADDPILDSIGNKTVDELTLLTFTATAMDADVPPDILTFSLSGDVPDGATITDGGDFTWTPSEAQGGQDYTFNVVVTDVLAASAFEEITVTVDDVNIAPVLDSIATPKAASEGVELSFTATATDADLPADILTFSLSGSVPAGAIITAGGNFTWTPSETQGGLGFTFNVVVTDNGVGTLSDFAEITMDVSGVEKERMFHSLPKP